MTIRELIALLEAAEKRTAPGATVVVCIVGDDVPAECRSVVAVRLDLAPGMVVIQIH